MKKLILILLLFGCSSSNKMVYWCGDHPCINNKEKKAYFKKTMTVEMRELSSVKKMSKSEIEKIKEQLKEVKKGSNELAKESRLEEKRKIKEEKLRIKEEKKLAKKREKEEKKLAKKREKEQKKLAKKSKKIEKLETKKEENPEKKIVIDTGIATIDVASGFQALVEKISKRNKVKPYPDINNVSK